MTQPDIRQKLHEFIDTIEDKKAEAIYILFENDINNDVRRLNIIQEERASYLKGEGKSYSWDEVKSMAVNKGTRDGLQD